MATNSTISCSQFKNFLVSQEPVYDQLILKDVRPYASGLLGYYQSGTFDAYSGVTHTFDRFKSVFPNVTKPWTATTGGMTSDGVATDCTGAPCDPTENKIGWGFDRKTYSLENQSWGSQILCFDDIMTRTKAKEHFRQIINDVLRPATAWIMNYYLQRKALELAGTVYSVAAGLPTLTWTWDAGGYSSATITGTDPTGLLTPDILRSRVTRQYLLGAIDAGKDGFNSLQLHTDKDTFHYLAKEDSTLKSAWRFGEFGPAAKEFYKYGLMGYVGDYMVKVLQFPLRFNKTATNKFNLVLPYKNVSVTEGIGSDFNADYEKAQYQISYINNPKALRVLPFKPEAVNQQMPFLVRDYAGQWRFATNDLGADCAGRPIDNSRGNKGKFIADFRIAVKPEHPEWLEAIFHKRDYPAITIVSTTNADPGYPTQTYDSANAACSSVIVFDTAKKADNTYAINANTIRVNGNTIVHSAVTGATLALFVTDLIAKWAAATPAQTGTWATYDATAAQISLTGGVYTTIDLPFTTS